MEEIAFRLVKATAFFFTVVWAVHHTSVRCHAAAERAARLLIAEKGARKAIVVVSPDATAPEKHAATELASFLEQVTKTEFPVVEQHDAERPCVLVGSDAARWVDKKFSLDGLGQEGIVVRTIGKDLILAGGRPRGTLYAVYTFLEDYVGCRWWTPTLSTLPRKPTLTIKPLNIRYVPAFEYREPMWNEIYDRDWSVRNKVVHIAGSYSPTELKWTEQSSWNYIPALGYGHTFGVFAQTDAFIKHPEWFSEVNGRRMLRSEQGQLCLTNPEMRKEFIKSVRWFLTRENFPFKGIWVGQNDWGGYCQCATCKAFDKKEGSPSGTIVDFVNTVAADLEKDYPDLDIWTLAYDYSQSPPKHVKPRKNVVIWLATTGCARNKPLTHPVNREFRQRLEAWSKICDRIYIWDYVTNFSHYLMPFPNLQSLGPNVKIFAEHHVRGVRGQGAWDATGAEFSELRAWVQSKLYWNPTRNADTLIDEFLDAYYGKAAHHIRDYLKIVQDAAERSGEGIGEGISPYAKFLSYEVLIKSVNCLKSAESACGSADGRLRVQKILLGLQYVYLSRWDELWSTAKEKGDDWPFAKSFDQEYETFMMVSRKGGITRFSEADARDGMPMIRQRLGRRPAKPPVECKKLSRDRWVDLQDGGLSINNSNTQPQIVDDPHASDGKAAILKADQNTTYSLWRVPFISAVGSQKLRCRISVRCDLGGTKGPVFECGITDGAGGKVETSLTITADQVRGNHYQTFDLGTHDLSGWRFIWFKLAGNPQNVRQVLVDRIYLTHESNVTE